MVNVNEIIDELAKEHYGHVTPSTPDHFYLTRFLTALKMRLNHAIEPEKKAEKQIDHPTPNDGE